MGENVLGTGNRKYKGRELGVYLVCLKDNRSPPRPAPLEMRSDRYGQGVQIM